MSMSRILAVSTAVPSHRLEQATARREMARLCHGHPHLERIMSVFDRAGVDSRYVVHPPEWYTAGRTFEERNREYVACGLELAEQAARACLARARVDPSEVDHLYFVTTTGLTTPSLDARLVPRLGLRPTVRRWPLFGLGCAGGAGALSRASGMLRAQPDEYALVVSVELCSLVFSTQALTPTDLVGVALFGDGAAAVLVGGDDVPGDGITVVGTETHLFPEAQHLMGWEFTGDGMRLVLSRDIPAFVRERLAPVIEKFAMAHGARVGELTHLVLHPGGPKVMATYRSAFDLSEEAVSVSRDSMRRFGNLSSASVLFMLDDIVASGRPRPGNTGLMLALGPGFAAEVLMLSW